MISSPKTLRSYYIGIRTSLIIKLFCLFVLIGSKQKNSTKHFLSKVGQITRQKDATHIMWGCTRSVTVIIIGNEHSYPSSILAKAVCILTRANTLGKGIHIPLSSVMGK